MSATQTAEASMSAQKLEELLSKADWTDFWQKVNEEVAQEVDAYHLARKKSLNLY